MQTDVARMRISTTAHLGFLRAGAKHDARCTMHRLAWLTGAGAAIARFAAAAADSASIVVEVGCI